MQKTMFFDHFGRDCFAAVAEDGRLVEFHLDAIDTPEIAGNIFKGRVVNVVNGMQAAFVSFGQEKNGYLYAGDIPAGAEGVPVSDRLSVRPGDEVMVQVAKAPMGTKGARLTMDLSFVGKNLIYMPTASFCALSRKIEDSEERARLLEIAEKLRAACGGGFILRTNAQNADLRILRAEAKYLCALYATAREAYETASVGDAVYRDGDVHARLLRDFDLSDVNKIYIGNEETCRKVDALLRRAHIRSKAVLYRGEREMFEFFGLEEQVYRLIDRRVELENGAYLVFDRTEALTAVDVNTGRFTGETGLEDTVFTTNLLAAREIARQVRLRNVGGIVVVDFIDMVSEEHRAAVAAELERCLREDRAKCNVTPMSDLGLVQFTRKKVRSDNVSALTKPCPYCRGTGAMVSDSYMAFRIRIAIKKCFASGYESAVVELNAGLCSYIFTSRCYADCLRGEWRGKRVYLVPHRTFHEEYFTVRGDNSSVLTLSDRAQLLY